MRWLPLLALAACLSPASVPCGDGDLCPPGTECRAVTNPDQKLCASADQIAQCTNKPDYTRCNPNGRCYSGVCLPIVCGNGRIDKADPNDSMDTGESCDDGNQASGDGCSADCLSNETCGNGFLDPVASELCDDGNRVGHDGCDNGCDLEQPRWTKFVLGPPSTRGGYGLAYDEARRKVVLFGGVDFDTGQPMNDTWEWDGDGWAQIQTTYGPTPRGALNMVYDAAHRVVVLYGGGRGSPDGLSSETWLWDGKHWSAALTANNPGRRASFGMTYDSARKRVVLFAGLIDNNINIGNSNETWEWDGTDWTQKITATVPDRVSNNTLAYDPVRGVVVAFGSRSGPNNNLWEYDGVDWKKFAPSGTWPAQREDAAMAWDPTLKRIILFGGMLTSNNTDTAQTYSWDGQTWSLLTPASSPTARSAISAVTDSTRGRIVTWGGLPTDVDTWEWNGAKWLDVPMPKIGSQASPVVYDSRRGRTILVSTDVGPAQIWEFDGQAWTTIATTSTQPNPGVAPSAAFDEAHHQLVLFGGSTLDPKTWLWDGANWTNVASGPPPRVNATMAYDASRGKVVLFGGNDGNGLFSDTWELDGSMWNQISTSASPHMRQSATLAYDPLRKQIVLFGGIDENANALGDTWTYDGVTWTQLSPAASPTERGSPAIAWYAARKHLVLFGGRKAASWFNDAWEWTGKTWQRLPIPVTPSERTGAALFPLPDNGLGMFGGSFGFSFTFKTFDDTWRLRWEGDTPDDTCHDQIDVDGDQLVGCADGDCALVCTGCGDGVCTPELEDCRICPADCACTARCGDFYCDAPETHATCPGDCP